MWIPFWLRGTQLRTTAKRRFADHVAAVHLQHDRLLAPMPSVPSADDEARRRVDLLQYISAARQVLRAVQALQRIHQHPHLQQAIDTFEQATPLVKDFRDLFEHFDAYDEGSGNRQRAGAVPRSPPNEHYSFSTTDASVEAYGQRLTISVTTPAVDALAQTVEQLAFPDSGW